MAFQIAGAGNHVAFLMANVCAMEHFRVSLVTGLCSTLLEHLEQHKSATMSTLEVWLRDKATI